MVIQAHVSISAYFKPKLCVYIDWCNDDSKDKLNVVIDKIEHTKII